MPSKKMPSEKVALDDFDDMLPDVVSRPKGRASEDHELHITVTGGLPNLPIADGPAAHIGKNVDDLPHPYRQAIKDRETALAALNEAHRHLAEAEKKLELANTVLRAQEQLYLAGH